MARCVFLLGCKSNACGTYYAIVADEQIELLESQKAQAEIDFRQELENEYQCQLQMLTEENMAKLHLMASRQENGDVARTEVSEKGERGDHEGERRSLLSPHHDVFGVPNNLTMRFE
jgi:hypothetical protein